MSSYDDGTFRDFVTAYRPRLVRHAFLLCGDPDEAHDLVQIALERLHRRWRQVERVEVPEAYVRRVLINLASSWWRRRLRVRVVPYADLPPAAERRESDRSAAYAERDALWRAVMTLPPRTRAVLVLRYFEDLSEAETARQLGCSVGAVKSQCSRGLARLRTTWDMTVDPIAYPL